MVVKDLVGQLLKLSQDADVKILEYNANPLDGMDSDVESIFEIKAPNEQSDRNAVYLQMS